MRMIINPGTGPVHNSTEDNAIENIKHFITDCNIEGVEWVRIPDEDYGEGRYAFLLRKDSGSHVIQMPGLPIEKVRYKGSHQNIWNFPRLYVDGSSWIWQFATGIVIGKFEDELV